MAEAAPGGLCRCGSQGRTLKVCGVCRCSPSTRTQSLWIASSTREVVQHRVLLPVDMAAYHRRGRGRHQPGSVLRCGKNEATASAFLRKA